MGIENSTFHLVNDLCDIEVYIASLKYRVRITIEGKSCTRMESRIFVPRHALYLHLPHFWVYQMRHITKQNLLI